MPLSDLFHASPRAAQVLRHPGTFIWHALKAFRANQGLLLAGAVAYYALLSLVPMLILIVIVLSHIVDPMELLMTLRRYLELLLPGQATEIIGELANFLEHRDVVGWLVLATMLFFSSLAFTVLEKAISVIFHHRFEVRRRHFLVSALLPFCYMLFLAMGLLVVTLVAGMLQALGDNNVRWMGREWSLGPVSGAMFYLLGVVGEVLIFTSIYMVMPVGRLWLRHALVGGITASLLWEITRHLLLWYLTSLSQVSVVYGSLATAIVVLLSLELFAGLLLFGAQVISEYERIGAAEADRPPPTLPAG